MEMNPRFNILTTATDWIKRILKNIFERMLTKMTPPSLDLVDNLTPLGLCQSKTLLPERRMNFKRVFLNIFKLYELRMFWSNLFHSIIAEGKEGI